MSPCRQTSAIIVTALLAVHSMLLAWSAYRHSPVTTEVGHLPAGLSHWLHGSFDLYRVNPPLVRMVAAIPVLFMKPNTDWSRYDSDPLIRSETPVGQDFVKANGSRVFLLYAIARWACIPFSVIGAIICYRWAAELYGATSGLVAAALWCFCPNVLGHGALMMTDVPAAALAMWACYSFRRWLQKPTWLNTVRAGMVLGAAELAKSTLIVLFPLWPLMWFAYRIPRRRSMPIWLWFEEGGMLLLRMAISIYVINLGYGFEGSFQKLGSYRFQSHVLTGTSTEEKRFPPGNRFVGTWLEKLPVPLPCNYVQGFDSQKVDFERGIPSFLNGEWSKHGWWYFYLYAALLKVPLGTWLLGALALGNLIVWRRETAWREEGLLCLPLVSIFVFVSAQRGFSVHFRYVFAVLPLAFVWISRSFSAGSGARSVRLMLGTGGLVWSIGSSLWCYPHSLAYFNEIAGGQRQGHKYLLDSCIAFGQDLLYLKRWYDNHPEARPLQVAAFGLLDPNLAGVDCRIPPLGSLDVVQANRSKGRYRGPVPGWYAIDVNYLQGSDRPVPDNQGGFEAAKDGQFDLTYFTNFQPIAYVGGSFVIYHLTEDNVDNVHRDAGLSLHSSTNSSGLRTP